MFVLDCVRDSVLGHIVSQWRFSKIVGTWSRGILKGFPDFSYGIGSIWLNMTYIGLIKSKPSFSSKGLTAISFGHKCV